MSDHVRARERSRSVAMHAAMVTRRRNFVSIDIPAALPLPSERPARRSLARLAYRVLTAPLRFFAAHDVFISYCRRDGSAYAEALANYLADRPRRFSCFIDQWDGNPQTRIPAATLRAARWSGALVVLATPEALRSVSVEEEIREFGRMGVPRPIQVVVFPGVPAQAARWHGLVAGVPPTIEDGVQPLDRLSPSGVVLGRIERSVSFWHRNRRIRWGVALATVWLLIAAGAAVAAGRRASALNLATRAEDRLANDPSQTADALKLAVESLARSPTPWGESAVRKGLMLLPTFRGSVAVERQGRAAFGAGGVLAQWYRDEARSDSERNVYRVVLMDSRRGTPVRSPVEVPEVVRNVRFTPDGTGVVAGASSEISGPMEAVYWIPRDGGAPRRFPLGPAGAFALHPAGASLAVANRAVERWTLGRTPVKTAGWMPGDVRALAFSPDGSRLFALEGDRLLSIDARTPSAPVVTLARVPQGEEAALLATEGHVVVVGDSIRTWSLAAAAWDHAFEAGTAQAAVAGDRLAVWTWWDASIRDLGAEGADFHAHAVRAGCGGVSTRPDTLHHLAVSGDGRRAALACSDGTARVVSTSDGTLLAVAPAADAVPRAVHLDGPGNELRVYATVPAATGPRARIAGWTVVNRSSDRIGAGAMPTALAFALDSRGGALAAVFQAAPPAYGLAVYDPLTGREQARADTALEGGFFRVAFDGGRVALADERGVSIWRVAGDRLRLEGTFGVRNAIALQFGGPDAARLAISSARGDAVEVTVLDRGTRGWRRSPPLRATSWQMPGRSDPIEFAPVAVSAAGRLAFLADTAGPTASTVKVVAGGGASIILPHHEAVTLLRFLDTGELLTATRTGEVWAWSLDAPRPRRRRIGRHGSPVMALVPGEDGRIVAIDRGNVVRMWALDTPAGDAGLRGYMEFPINHFGIMNDDALGTRALGFSGERLVTVNQHSRGLFANAWVVPRRARLAAAAAERLGSPR